MAFWNKRGKSVTHTQFAELITDGLKKAGDKRNVVFEEDDFRLVFFEDDQECGVLNLANFHVEFEKLEAEGREKRISEIVRAALSHLKPIPEDYQDASHDLRPRLWARSTFEMMKLRQRLEGGEEPNWPLESIGEHLYLSLVFDLPESVRSLSNEELESWNVSYWEAREVAIKNLSEEDLVVASLGDVLYASNTRDSYDATRMVLEPLIEQLTFEGDPVAMVPNRDTLLMTGSQSEVGLKMMVELAVTELSENPRPLIATPLIYLDGQWQDWEFPSDHPSYEEYRRCLLGWKQFEYDNQKKLLDEINEVHLVEEFVANFTVVSRDDRHVSYCVWSKDIKSSLPQTDLIAFMDGDGQEVAAFGDWNRVLEVCSDLMIEQDVYPPRFRVDEFPSDEMLSTIGSIVTNDSSR